MKKIFYWLIDKWLGGFLIGSSLLLLKKYFDLPEESRSNFSNFDWFGAMLNLRIPLWTVFIIVICLIIITRFEKSILKSKFKSNVDDKSDVDDNLKIPKNPSEHYKSDVFGVNNTKWTWNYIWRIDYKKFQIVNLNPSCPHCDIPAEITKIDTILPPYGSCHKCRLAGRNGYFDLNDDIRDIDKEIKRRIANKETGT